MPAWRSSRVKKDEVTSSAEIVAQAKKEIPVPNVVNGGMTHNNAVPLVKQGTDMVAAISSVDIAADPERVARECAALFT